MEGNRSVDVYVWPTAPCSSSKVWAGAKSKPWRRQKQVVDHEPIDHRLISLTAHASSNDSSRILEARMHVVPFINIAGCDDGPVAKAAPICDAYCMSDDSGEKLSHMNKVIITCPPNVCAQFWLPNQGTTLSGIQRQLRHQDRPAFERYPGAPHLHKAVAAPTQKGLRRGNKKSS